MPTSRTESNGPKSAGLKGQTSTASLTITVNTHGQFIYDFTDNKGKRSPGNSVPLPPSEPIVFVFASPGGIQFKGLSPFDSDAPVLDPKNPYHQTWTVSQTAQFGHYPYTVAIIDGSGRLHTDDPEVVIVRGQRPKD